MKYSIVIPCYNESGNLIHLVEKFSEVVARHPDMEVILVNNGSTDNSDVLLESIKDKYFFVRVTKVEINQGYGYGILQGIRRAQGDYVGWMHADLQFAPKELEKAIKFIEDNGNPRNIFLRGKRKNRPIIDKLFTVGMSIFETLYLHMGLYDINAQPTLMHRDFCSSWIDPPWDFSLDLYAYYYAKKKNYCIYRFPVRQTPREAGVSSWNNGIRARVSLVKRVIEYTKQLKSTL